MSINMDLLKMIAELRSEREAVDNAILVLERIAAGHGGKRRGRPPAWLKAHTVTNSARPAATGKKRLVSPEVKQRMAEGQRRRWEAYRKAQGKE
jgi:hypothetical protein